MERRITVIRQRRRTTIVQQWRTTIRQRRSGISTSGSVLASGGCSILASGGCSVLASGGCSVLASGGCSVLASGGSGGSTIPEFKGAERGGGGRGFFFVVALFYSGGSAYCSGPSVLARGGLPPFWKPTDSLARITSGFSDHKFSWVEIRLNASFLPVADVLLWRNRNVSAAILTLATVIWLLLVVVEYQFLALLCHLSIAAMFIIFIWSNGAALLDRTPPKIPEIILSESAFTKVASTFRTELNRLLTKLYEIACGKDLRLFILVITSLWVSSVIGTYFSSMNLLYLGFLCIHVLPALYERYEQDVDKFVIRGQRNLKKTYRRFDSEVLNKIPRGSVKEKKSS